MNTKILLASLLLSTICFAITGNSQITGTFTADNCYSVYVGSNSGVSTKVMPSNGNGHCNKKAGEIFSPQQQTFAATVNDYLYIMAWSDDRTCQGLLGEFTGQQTIKTGQAGWQVYPTNRNYGNNQAPTQSEINQYISQANSTNGWVAPFVGTTNAQGKQSCSAYVKVNGISDDAKWIWHNAKKGASSPRDVIGRGYNHKEFLIFRFPVRQIGTTGGSTGGSTPTFDPCCPPIAEEDLASSLQVSGNLQQYKPKLVLGRDLTNRLQAYAEYVMALDPCLKHVTLEYVIRKADRQPNQFSFAPSSILSRGATVFKKNQRPSTWGQGQLSDIVLNGNTWYRLDFVIYGGPDSCPRWNFAEGCGLQTLEFNLQSKGDPTRSGNFQGTLKSVNAKMKYK